MPWLTLAETAAALSVSERTVSRRIAAGILPSRRDRGRVLVFVADPMSDSVADVADTAGVTDTAAGSVADSVTALVAQHDHELAALAHRLGVAERTAPRWARAALVALSLLVVAALAVVAVGYRELTAAQVDAQLAGQRLDDAQAQLDGLQADLDDARTRSQDLQARLDVAQAAAAESAQHVADLGRLAIRLAQAAPSTMPTAIATTQPAATMPTAQAQVAGDDLDWW